MSKFIYSFFIAIVLHIIVLVLSTSLRGIEQDNDLDSMSGRNLIDVNFGSAGQKKSAAKSSPALKPATKTDSSVSTSESASSSTSSTGETQSASDSGSGTGSGSFESSVISFEGPMYPRQAQVRGLEGVVRLKIDVSEEGMPTNTIILQSSGHTILDRAATAVVPRWRFQKRAAPYSLEKNIVFKLKG